MFNFECAHALLTSHFLPKKDEIPFPLACTAFFGFAFGFGWGFDSFAFAPPPKESMPCLRSSGFAPLLLVALPPAIIMELSAGRGADGIGSSSVPSSFGSQLKSQVTV